LGLIICFLNGKHILDQSVAVAAPFPVGEKIEYDIKKFGIKVGESTFEYKGEVQIENKQALWVTVIAKGLKFFDQEDIYLNPKTLYPIIVKRNINIFGKKEQIIEKYFQEKGILEISGQRKKGDAPTIIQKDSPIDNIYGFIYRYRMRGKFKRGEQLDIQLPTKDVAMTLLEDKRIKVAGRKYEAFYMEDKSRDIKVWFDKSKIKIPLRINGAIGFGETSMVFKKYNKILNGQN